MKIENCPPRLVGEAGKLKIAFALFFFFLLAGNSAKAGLILGAPKYAGLSQGLVGYWSFNGPDMAGIPSTATSPATAYDRSGNGNDGKYYNATGTSPVSGKIGQALTFDGMNDFIVSSIAGSLDAVTESAWIKLNTVNGNQGIIYSNDGGRFEVTGTELRWGHSAGSGFKITSGANLASGAWYHVAATFNETTNEVKIYINGILALNTSENFDIVSETQNTFIGTSGSTLGLGTDFLNGIIDDARFYNRALTADEVKRLYKIGATLKMGVSRANDTLANGLVGWWTFDGPDMAGNIAYDRGGTTTENGTLTNGPTVINGKLGQALNFDGVDDVMNIPDSQIAELNQGSITAWIYTSDSSPSIFQENCSGGNCFVECTGSFLFGGTTVSGLLYIRISQRSYNICGTQGVRGNTPLKPNTWYFVTGTSDGNTWKLYLNGSEESLTTTVTNNGNWLADTFPGQAHASYIGNEANSILDDVRVYNRALTADEIKRLYKIGATLKMGVSKANDTLQNGLVGWWTFDGPDMEWKANRAYDKSGQNNFGTLFNMSTTSSPVNGKLGQALSFDGVNDLVRTNPFDSSSRYQFTWSAWVYLNQISGDQTIILSGKSDFTEGININSAGKIVLRTDGSTNLTSNTSLSPGKWYNITATMSAEPNNGSILYINGVIDKVGVTGGFGLSSCPMTIGGQDTEALACTGTTYGNFLNGAIDDVRIYNRTLSADEIKRLYNLGR